MPNLAPGQLTAHFHLDEFRCPCCREAIRTEAQPLAERLELVRLEYGPMVINSGYRCPARNKKKKGAKNSQHMLGKAADIACTSDRDRFWLVALLIAHGFTRLGIGAGIIHADRGYQVAGKNPALMWTYYGLVY